MSQHATLYALDKAGLTPASLKVAISHGEPDCPCEPCRRLAIYARIYNTIKAWEDHKLDLERRNTPRRNRRCR